MSNISKCENCGCEMIDVIHKYKGYYVCPKCGRDTERLYEIEHDAEIRAKAIDEFAEKIQWEYLNSCGLKQREIDFLVAVSSMVAEQMKAGADNE